MQLSRFLARVVKERWIGKSKVILSTIYYIRLYNISVLGAKCRQQHAYDYNEGKTKKNIVYSHVSGSVMMFAVKMFTIFTILV